MAGDDIRRYSLADINAMRAKGMGEPTPADAPEIELDEGFWRATELVHAAPRRKTSVHLRVDPETLRFFKASGRGHLTRMARVLKAYADSHEPAE